MALVQSPDQKMTARKMTAQKLTAMRFIALAGTAVMLVSGFGIPTVTAAQQRESTNTYTALTANMSPTGVELQADILDWSDETQRSAAVAALDAEDPVAALRDLPTLGIVWRSGSVIGHAVKYAHRAELADGGERIVLVTDRRIGYSGFSPWLADDGSDDSSLGYSVMELRTGPDSGGTLSLGADIVIDRDRGLISLDRGGREPLLVDVAKQPPPYWAAED